MWKGVLMFYVNTSIYVTFWTACLVHTCVDVWMGDSEHELEYICLYVCACGCVSWCLFCAPLLMHRHSRDVRTNGGWSCRGCIDRSDLQIIALKSDQQQHTEVKTSLANRSAAALPWEATCLIVCGVLQPLLLRALGEKGKSGPDLSLP